MLLLNGKPIDHFIFSGGEFQIKLPHEIEGDRVILTWKPVDAGEITFLALTINALKNMGIYDIDLDVLYLPYARQDRVCSEGEAHSLEVICQFLEMIKVTTIRFWDLHNEKAVADLLPNNYVWHWEAYEIFAKYKLLDNFDLSNLVLCAPDQGACERVDHIVKYFNLPDPIYLLKKRNPSTGFIEEITVPVTNRVFNGYDVLIVDDICDGGATFNQAAQVLKQEGAENLYLYVTHGIFSKGLDLLQQNFKHIYCHHVLHDDKYQSTDRLTILKEHPFEL